MLFSAYCLDLAVYFMVGYWYLPFFLLSIDALLHCFLIRMNCQCCLLLSLCIEYWPVRSSYQLHRNGKARVGDKPIDVKTVSYFMPACQFTIETKSEGVNYM